MSIRESIVEDAKSLSNLVLSLAHDLMSEDKTEIPNWLRESLACESFEKRLSSNEFISYVYEIDGIIKGYISMKKPNHIYHLFVDKDVQRQGIAKKLWHHLSGNTHNHQVTLNSSLKAVPVYQKFGFIISGQKSEKDGIAYVPMVFNE